MTDTLDDKLYEILDAFALEYLDAHMEPDYGIGQRLQVEAELLQDVKKQINLYIEERERLARIDELKSIGLDNSGEVLVFIDPLHEVRIEDRIKRLEADNATKD